MEEDKLSEVGLIVVDEVHMLADTDRGYLLELMLTKLMYTNTDRQIVGLSATIPNAEVLQRWLKAALYVTMYRPVPLKEFMKVEEKIFDSDGKLVRSISPIYPATTDP